MKTIFDQNIREQLISRIEQVNEDHKAKWGKMNVLQMLKHNTYWSGWILGTDPIVTNKLLWVSYLGK
ncbi:hypothetical protein [Flavobacterium sp.]|uniref:hypothetical protein n=1 Tax=Flavobacterium sp. TaxID=239 RepID=UPI003A9512F2